MKAKAVYRFTGHFIGAALILYMLISTGLAWIEPDPKGLSAFFLSVIAIATGMLGASGVVAHSVVIKRVVINLLTLLPLQLNLFLCVVLWPSLFNESVAILALIPYAMVSFQVAGWGYCLWAKRPERRAAGRF